MDICGCDLPPWTFDWWRVSRNGCMVVVPQTCQSSLSSRCTSSSSCSSHRHEVLTPEEICWPVARPDSQRSDSSFSSSSTSSGCSNSSRDDTISPDFWPDKGDRSWKRPKYEHARPPWSPYIRANRFGIVKWPPLVSRNCRCKDKPIRYVCKT